MSDLTEPSGQPSADFVFGTLATDALRLAHLKAARASIAHTLEPADPPPGAPITLTVTLGPQVVADQVACYYTTDGTEPEGARGVAANGAVLLLERGGSAWDTLLWGYLETWRGVFPPQPAGTLLRYRIEAWQHGGATRWADEIAGVVAGERPAGVRDEDAGLFAVGGAALWPLRRPGRYAVHVDDERVPAWLREAIIYQVFVDRFAPGAGRGFARPETPGGFFGGTLRGVIERLDYIAALGATCIWLSPIFPSPSHHGYDATDYAAVEPRLGAEADLRDLVAAAHARGIRVLLDYVVNHVSDRHPAFQAALAAPDAPEAAWFTFTRWPDQYLSFFGVRDHPQIDADAPAARDYMIRCATRWLALGVDGFRLDYANGPTHAFWSAFRAATRAAAPESATIGEVVETPALQASYAGRMDGCLDFLLLQALRQFFAFGTIGPRAFDAFVRRHLAYFPPEFVLPSFLDNHDMNRFLWVVRGDTRRLKLAALCQFTLPHPPIIYYGTEVGLSQQRDVRYPDGSGHPEEARLPMLWGDAQDAALLDFYQRLGAFRRAHAAVWRAPRTTLLADDVTGVLLYRCGADVMVALNNGPAPRRVPVDPVLRVGIATDPEVALTGGPLLLPPFAGAALVA